jgi:ABC-type glycerol-3-phosphate transport system substrate-binding protein
MRRKARLATTVAIATTAALTACSGSGTPGTDEGDGSATINLWHTESTPITVEAMQEIIDEYEAANPGVEIIQETVAWGDLQVKFQAALAAGDLPEITHVEPMFVRTLYGQDLLLPLDEVVESFDGDYLPQLQEMFELEDGHTYGVVHAWGTDTTTYRADMYANAPEAGTPEDVTTWDESIEQWSAVAEANPGVSPLLLAGAAAHNVNEEVYLWLGSNGGTLFDENGHVTIDTPEMIEVLEYWKELKDTGILAPEWSSAAYADTLSGLANGDAATIYSFGRAVYTFQEQAPDLVPGEDIRVYGPRPIGPSGDDWITQLDAEPFVVFKDSPDADATIDFLKFFYEHDNYLSWIGTVPTQLLPVMPSMFEDPEWQALPEVQEWDFWIDVQREALDSGRAYPLMVTSSDEMSLPYLSDLYGSAILVDMVMEVVESGVDPAEAAATAQQRADELLSPQYQD